MQSFDEIVWYVHACHRLLVNQDYQESHIQWNSLQDHTVLNELDHETELKVQCFYTQVCVGIKFHKSDTNKTLNQVHLLWSRTRNWDTVCIVSIYSDEGLLGYTAWAVVLKVEKILKGTKKRTVMICSFGWCFKIYGKFYDADQMYL